MLNLSRSKHVLVGLAMLVVGAVSAPKADAEVLFWHNFPTAADPQLSFCTSCFGNSRLWDRFVLNQASNVTEIQALLSSEFNSASYNLGVTIWDETRTIKLFDRSYTAATLNISAGPFASSNVVSAVFPSLTLGRGAYYLSIYNNDPTTTLTWFASSTLWDRKSIQTLGGAPTSPPAGLGNGRDLAFQVVGTPVPEPGTLILLGAGLVATVARVRRRG